jgi:hypothetical protein
MIRRLGVNTPREQPEILLTQVRPPSRSQGNCGLVACLQRALEAGGQNVSYAWLMGLGGQAFMLQVDAGLGAELAVLGRADHAVPALQALGHRAQRLGGGSPEVWREALIAELQAGRPVPVLGWGSFPHDWALLVGRQGEQWLGWPQGGSAAPESAPGEPAEAVLLGPPQPATPTEEALREVLWRASGLLLLSQGAYGQWRELLAAEQPFGRPPGVRERLAAEQWLVDCLVDARHAGYEFLQVAAEMLPEAAADRLLEAAEGLAAVAEMTEQLLSAPLDGGGLDPERDPGWLADHAEGLSAVARAEWQVLKQLQEVLAEAGIEPAEEK